MVALKIVLFASLALGISYLAKKYLPASPSYDPNPLPETRALLAELQRRFALGRLPGETDPVFVGMTTWKIMNNRQFWVGLTNQRLLMTETDGGSPLRSYGRAEASVRAARKKFVDTGNMTTRITHGWEVEIRLPRNQDGEGEAYTMRLYPWYQAEAAQAFARALGA